jgi:CBS domain-containing protein
VKIEEVMTTDVTTVAPHASLKSVAETLATRRISGVPIVQDERVIGVVSEADILVKEARESQPTAVDRLLGREPAYAKRAARSARDAMTKPAVTVSPRCDVSQAARLMIERGINRLPVVNDDDLLVGIVSRADLVRAFVRSDEAIAREVREDVAATTLWLDPRTLQIDVEDGNVTLGGTVEMKADADLLAKLTARVPGVVSVRSNLAWRVEAPKLPQSDPHVPQPSHR